jgi:hypothetical protein
MSMCWKLYSACFRQLGLKICILHACGHCLPALAHLSLLIQLLVAWHLLLALTDALFEIQNDTHALAGLKCAIP